MKSDSTDLGVPRPREIEEPVVVYTRSFCMYCTLAIGLLQGRQVRFREISVAGNTRARAWLREATRQATVPQVFIHGRSIGGFTELAALDRDGQLDQMFERHQAR